MKTILVPVDFSQESLYAFDFACELAARNRALLKLFHVVESRVSVYQGIAGVQISHSEEAKLYEYFMTQVAKQKLEELAAQKKGQAEIEVYIQVGNFFHSIAENIANKPVDLIVMGSHGISNHNYEYVGSNTEKVVRYANCPVLVIKERISWDEINTIAFLNSLYEEDMSDALLQQILQWQEVLQAKLHLVRINVPGDVMPYREIQRRAKDWLGRWGAKDFSVVEYSSINEEEGVLQYVEDFQIDSIAIGTHGRRGLRRLLSVRPSVAEGIARGARVPVWTYKIY